VKAFGDVMKASDIRKEDTGGTQDELLRLRKDSSTFDAGARAVGESAHFIKELRRDIARRRKRCSGET
jgi:ribosomal protein L29